MLNLVDLTTPERIVFLGPVAKAEAIETLVGAIAGDNKAARQQYLDAVLDRENVLSTGLGSGMALPHGRIPGLESFSMAFGISTEGVSDYVSLDDRPVQVLACIIGPDEKSNEYLKLLARATRFLKGERDGLLACTNGEEVMALLGRHSS